MQAAGYTVTRVENIGNPQQTHYTFTNVVMCNGIVLLPQYDNIPASYSANALAAWQARCRTSRSSRSTATRSSGPRG
jgi:hypothetical protein